MISSALVESNSQELFKALRKSPSVIIPCKLPFSITHAAPSGYLVISDTTRLIVSLGFRQATLFNDCTTSFTRSIKFLPSCPPGCVRA